VPVVVPEPDAEPMVALPPPTQRPGLETLFRFSAFDVDTAMAEQGRANAEAVLPPPVAAPPPIAAVPAVAPPPPPPASAPVPPPPVAAPPAVVPAPPLPAPAPPPVTSAAIPAHAPPVAPAAPAAFASPIVDAGEIVSPTIAELYFGQGHIDKAIDVYRRLLRGGPENEKARRRLLELEALERRNREEAPAGAGGNGASRAERRATLERTIARLEALLTVIRKE
jgi:hypothetical protein